MSTMVDPSIRIFAAEALARRLVAMRRHVAGVRQADEIEAVHQMRVASRRLRAALQIFADVLPRAKVKRWRTDVRKVTRALGAARDLDVQIAFVDDVLGACDERRLRPGLARLRLRLSQQRQALQGRAEKAMDRLEQSALFTTMAHDLHQVQVDARLSGSARPGPALFRHARCVLMRRIEELLAYQQYVDQPHAKEPLHQMRIAAKRLRYTLEVFAPAYDGQIDRPLKRVKRLQSQLGDLHDLDVWIDRLPAFVEAERQRHREHFGRLAGFARLTHGLKWLQERCIGERLKAYEKFARTWWTLSERKTWPKLRRVLKQSIGPDAPVADPPPAPHIDTPPEPAPGPAPRAPAQPPRRDPTRISRN
jgi:CHAD domain-containing protein